jgi:hypothetical protein
VQNDLQYRGVAAVPVKRLLKNTIREITRTTAANTA